MGIIHSLRPHQEFNRPCAGLIVGYAAMELNPTKRKYRQNKKCPKWDIFYLTFDINSFTTSNTGRSLTGAMYL